MGMKVMPLNSRKTVDRLTLVLTPATSDGRPMYKFTGQVEIGGGPEKCRMQVVARDGIGTSTVAEST